jgi:hypothetical protein
VSRARTGLARRRRARSVEDAAAFIADVGISTVFPVADLVLPSLWEAVAGPGPLDWAIRDENGSFVSFTPEFDAMWRWKDELAEAGLACVGKHFGRTVVVVAPDLVRCAYALTGRSGRPDDFRDIELAPLQREIAEAVLACGGSSGRELRRLLGSDKRAVDRAVESLQRQLVLTSAGSVEQEQGWSAVKLDLLARRWQACLRRLPSVDDARSELAIRVLHTAGKVSAADLAAALGWRLELAKAVLDGLAAEGAATIRDEDGIRIWSPRRGSD